MFHVNEAGIVGFPQKLDVTNLAIFDTDFSILLHTV